MIYSKSFRPDPTQDHVLGLLTDSEPLTAHQLAAYAQVSQPTVSRALKGLGERVHRLGAARSTRYALVKDILGLPATHSLTWNGPDRDGNMPWDFGQITYLQDNWLHVQSAGHEWLTQGRLPWFLTPLQPAGFLGRALARARPDLPADPTKWSLAQILHVATTHTHDPIGAFFLGEVQTLNWSVPSSNEQLGAHFDLLAQTVEQEQGVVVGTSAGGEQPKFTTGHDDGRKSIVKFTTRRGNFAKAQISERWRSLLMLEHLALQILSSHSVLCARTQVIQTPERTYLQSQRFDRLGSEDAYAMRHVVALQAVHEEFVQAPWRDWIHTCDALMRKGLLHRRDVQEVARIQAFGQYILNRDMHWGNFSFFVDDVIEPRLALAPVYDMLPMLWKPADMSDAPIAEEPRIPSGYSQEYASARDWAIEFWERAALLDISPELQIASTESARRLKTKFAGM